LTKSDPGSAAFHEHLTVCAQIADKSYFVFFEKGFSDENIGVRLLGTSTKGCKDEKFLGGMLNATV